MDNYINIIKKWIQSYIIKLDLCPFAFYAFDKDKIFYRTELSIEADKQLQTFWNCITTLNNSKQYTSAILILPKGCEDFDHYLDLYDKANWLLDDTQMNEKYQLASFHPHYLFADEARDSVSHYTNRSPFPIIHILSVDEVSQAIHTHDNTEDIPINNIKTLESKGIQIIKEMLDKINSKK